MHKNFTHKRLVIQLFRIIKKCIALEKRNMVQFEGDNLYPSEIHLMLFMYHEQHRNVTHIARRLGMTKGAVSQTLSRLEKKKMLHKIKDPYQKNEVSIAFTPSGLQVIHYFQHLAHVMGSQHDQYFSDLSENDRQTIEDFLTYLEGTVDREHETMPGHRVNTSSIHHDSRRLKEHRAGKLSKKTHFFKKDLTK